MVVQAFDAGGRPVPGATVRWTSAVSGVGQVCAKRGEECRDGPLDLASDGEGLSQAWYRPLTFPGQTVTASLVGVTHPVVPFIVEVQGYLVQLDRGGCGPGDPASFRVPDGTTDALTTSLGATIVWELRSSGTCGARIKSTSVPRGGTPFESGDLSTGERFRWHPDAYGEWVYQDLVSGVVGRVILPAPPPPVERGPARIHLATASGTVLGPVVEGDWPSWSPDGGRLAFQREDKIYIVGSDGTGERLVAPGRTPAWSPNGHNLAFVNDEGISVLDLNGGVARTMVRHDFRDDVYPPWNMGLFEPSWSPDGSRLAFNHWGDGDMAIGLAYVVNEDGTNLRRLTEPLSYQTPERGPTWSPDGGGLAFWTGYGLTLIPFPGGAQRVILDGVFGSRLSWSSTEARLVFAHFLSADIWVVTTAGTGARILIPDGHSPSFSPDGARIAFVRHDPPANQRD